MKAKYVAWIAAYVTETYGKCAKVTEAMQADFPELVRVRGHYYCLIWGVRSHWWLVDTDGEVVDPTAAQFPSGGRGVYVPWEEGTPEPTGVCPNCGGYVYTGDTCCSENCSMEYMAYINSFR